MREISDPDGDYVYLVHDALGDVAVPPGASARYLMRPVRQAMQPFWLRIEPEIAPSFRIVDVRVGNRSQFEQAQEIPASQFMHGKGAALGDDFRCETIQTAMDFVLDVRNVGDIALPFRATWKCRAAPPATHRQLSALMGGGSSTWDAYRRLATAPPRSRQPATPIPGVPIAPPEPPAPLPVATALPPSAKPTRETARREPPGFGWDPHGEDD